MADLSMERVRKPKPRRMRLSSVANAIRLTKAFSEQEYEMGISALAARLGLAKSTVHRLATTLVEYDILEQNRETGKYRLGLALFELGALVRRKMDAASESRGQMHALVESTGETVQLAVLDHLSVLYIRIRESRQAVRMSSSPGSRAPAHCTSVGKVLLARQPHEVVRQGIDSGLPRYTENTITAPDALIEELAVVRSRGYAIDDEEIDVGLRCVVAAKVTSLRHDAPGLAERDRAKNRVLACQSRPATDCRIKVRLRPENVPRHRPARFQARLEGFRDLTHDMREFHFKAEHALGFMPGQYALFYLPGLEAPR